uniref:Uncharacterized protein n=1 Tax=Chrysotila carterae TaxID=13221 RepID=A0A7S4BZ34_CHRCT
MIYAEQRWLETGTRQRVLHISERELNLYCQNANKCATLLMILAGYCYDAYATGYMYDDLDGDLCGHRERACGEILYPLTNMFTTFLSLSTMWSCMLLTMLAPGKALHGSPDEFAYILRVVRSAGLAPAHALCTPDSGTHALTPPRERTQAHPRALMHVHARGRSHACTRTHTRGVSWAALPTSAQLSSDSAVFPSPPARCLLPFCPQHAVPVSCASHYHEIPCGPISPAQTFG